MANDGTIRTKQWDDSAFACLLDAACDGTISPTDLMELQDQLRDHTEAIDSYIDRFHLEASLSWDLSSIPSAEAIQLAGGESVDDETFGDKGIKDDSIKEEGIEPETAETEASESLPTREKHETVLQRVFRHEFSVGVAVAIVAVAALLVALAVIPVSEFIAGSKDEKQPTTPDAATEIATLTGWHRVDWIGEDRMTIRTDRIRAGQRLAFASGVVEITYDTGAKVVIEGPAEFRVGSDERGMMNEKEKKEQTNSGYLGLGRLVARVAGEDAKGFFVDTSDVRVEDLGTEFGVEVRRDGAADAVVLTGGVYVTRRTADGEWGNRIRLAAGQGAFVKASGGAVRKRDRVDEELLSDYREQMTAPLNEITPTLSRNAAVGLIAYWDFNSASGSTITDVSGNHLRGTMSGGAKLSASGGGHSGLAGDRAIDLMGNNDAQDRMTVAAEQFTPHNPGTNDFSVSLWVKPTKLGGVADHAPTNGYDVSLVAGSSSYVELVIGSGGNGGVGWAIPRTTRHSVVPNGTWQHVAVVVDRTNAKYWIYVDGVAETTYTIGEDAWLPNNIPNTVGNIALDASDLRIGDKNGGTQFEGYIDDYAIFSAALTAAEVRGLFERTLTPLTLTETGESKKAEALEQQETGGP